MNPCVDCGQPRPVGDAACPVCALSAALAGRYRVRRLLGRGGSGYTYEVEAPGTGERLALKVLPRIPDLDAMRRFRRQYEVLAGLDHPALPAVREVFEIGLDGRLALCFAQELIEGENLQAALHRGLRFDEARARAFLEAMLDILGYLHGLSPPVLHRDIKPSNIILRPDGSPALIDFDTARGEAVDPSMPDGTAVGTAGFVPFEQLAGRPVPASDLYGLGMTLVALLSRKDVLELPVERMRVRFEPFVNVSEGFARILAKLVEGDVAARFQSVDEVRRALAAPTPAAASSPAPASLAAGYPGGHVGRGRSVTVAEAERFGWARDRHQVWAVEATASSEWGSGWSASLAAGPPRVFPQYGDHPGAWAPRTAAAGIEWLDVTFPEAPPARALRVYETCAPGGIYAVTEGPDGPCLWMDEPCLRARQARVFEIGIQPPRPLKTVRLWLDTRHSPLWSQIDAVALVATEPVHPAGVDWFRRPRRRRALLLVAGGVLAAGWLLVGGGEPDPPPPDALITVSVAERLSPQAAAARGWPGDAPLVWAATATASSEYGDGWRAAEAVGPPDVFPRHGDLKGSWATLRAAAGAEWLQVGFPEAPPASTLLVFEANEPGAVHKAVDADSGETLWQGRPGLAADEARVLAIHLEPPRRLRAVRLHLDTRVSAGWNEIDAVALVPSTPP